jgi:hypothetical protein
MSGKSHRIEVMDDAMAEVLRQKSGMERLAIFLAHVVVRTRYVANSPARDSSRLDRGRDPARDGAENVAWSRLSPTVDGLHSPGMSTLETGARRFSRH